MDDDTLGDYWRDVSPILKEKAREKRENCFNDRLEYAKKQFEENNIPYKLCNETIGHFNLYFITITSYYFLIFSYAISNTYIITKSCTRNIKFTSVTPETH